MASDMATIFVDEINMLGADSARRAKFAAERPVRDMIHLESRIEIVAREIHKSRWEIENAETVDEK